MKRITILVLSFVFFGFGSEHSKVETNVVKQTGDKLEISFHISANKDMQLTHQAPWSLTLTETNNLDLKLKEGKFVTKEYQSSPAGFVVKTKAIGAQKGVFKYKMKAFVCTLDKKRCYPQTHQGEVSWSVAN